jgi:flagellar hook-basal body complex protein FliE
MKDLSIQGKLNLPSTFSEKKTGVEQEEGKSSFSDVLRNTIQDINNFKMTRTKLYQKCRCRILRVFTRQ